MANWINSAKACKLAKCAKSTLYNLDRKGKVETKKDPDNKNRKLYKRSDVKNIELGRESKTMIEEINENDIDKEKWITVKKAAEMRNCNPGTIYQWIEKGWVNAKKIDITLVNKEEIKLMDRGYNKQSVDEIKESKKKEDEKTIVADEHCKGCVFGEKVSKNKISCPFHRCIHQKGWSADQKEYERVG